MNQIITCFLAGGEASEINKTAGELQKSELVSKIHVFNGGEKLLSNPEINVILLSGKSMVSTNAVRQIASIADTEFILIYTKSLALKPGPWALERLVQLARDTSAGMVYSNHYTLKNGQTTPHPVNDYQDGSLRDDFDFGSLFLFRTAAFKEATDRMTTDFNFAGFYDLRLKVSQNHRLFRIPEFLYTEVETDLRSSGEKQFDYVDPKNRNVQIEMESACTMHLKAIGAWLKPEFPDVNFSIGDFPVVASVIIPVRNRAKTIEDAIRSVFSQHTNFDFNLIVVDNHSTDGTTEIIKSLATENSRLIHILPERLDLGIGGCWTTGIMDPHCGKFAVQLDSDDLYINDQVLQVVVDAFYKQQCAMVVGSYQMVNFKLEEIPPGLIDHREWSPDNGRNNALRINGLGAPRAFYTPVLREIKVPNSNYGEDYALGLMISRHYQIGRIYEPLYLCRRWDENSDASLDILKMNEHNLYKDRLRTQEVWARQALNGN